MFNVVKSGKIRAAINAFYLELLCHKNSNVPQNHLKAQHKAQGKMRKVHLSCHTHLS